MNRLFSINVLGVLCALLFCFLLSSCGTTLWKVPYYVGVRTPVVKDTKGDNTSYRWTRKPFNWKIHRIGSEYYAEMELHYYPHKMHKEIHWDVINGDHHPDINYDRTPAKRVRFCKLTEKERKELKLPPLPSAGGKTPPAGMTAQQAAKLQPVYICTKRCEGLPENLDMEAKHTWAHYAMLPVSAATFVALDLPCDIIGCSVFLLGALADAFGY